jgi:hypothetical protein
MSCWHSPCDVLDSVERLHTWHECYGSDASDVPFDKQVELIIGAFLLTTPKDKATTYAIRQELFEEKAGLTLTFGAKRMLVFDHVTEFLRASAERGEDISAVHWFLNTQFRPISWPTPQQRFKPGHVVWVAIVPKRSVRATVLETNWRVSTQVAATHLHTRRRLLHQDHFKGAQLKWRELRSCARPRPLHPQEASAAVARAVACPRGCARDFGAA